jgi:hypothetical protein
MHGGLAREGTMKIVINRCFGGFGISKEALWGLIQRGAKCVEKYKSKREGSLEELSDEGSGWEYESYTGVFVRGEFRYSINDREAFRGDPDLVDVVESLGSDAASGKFAELEVVEIPDDVEWYIHEYDGLESIYEEHRSWP